MSPNDVIFSAAGVTKNFAGLVAVNDLHVDLHEGEILGLIGPNGSGKTTFFNVVNGLYQATTGRVTHRGIEITNWPSYQVAEHGITRTFQNSRVLLNASALENVMVGGHLHARTGFFKVLLSNPEARRREARVRDAALANLEFVGLAAYADETARNMPYGAIKRLEIARALSTEPDILMLDEPAAGLNPAEADSLIGLVRQLHETGKTILIIEHNMRVVMGLCQRIIVIDAGTKIAEGPPEAIRNDAKVKEAYLGRGG